MRILIAEDDVALASFVKKGLEAEHYATDVSSDGEQSRAMAAFRGALRISTRLRMKTVR